jgi:SP family myo-inositol transporter-like MFS transporter 13
MLVVDRFGRRRLLVTFIPGMIAGLVWVTVTFVFMTRSTGNQLDASVTYEMKYVGNVLGALILFTCSFGLTYSHIVWYQSEFLALEIRAAGSAIATTACWVANLIVSISFLSMLNTMTPMGVYGFYLGLITIGYVFVHFCYPETSEFKSLAIEVIYTDGSQRDYPLTRPLYSSKKAMASGELGKCSPRSKNSLGDSSTNRRVCRRKLARRIIETGR